ncbi:hypothetical protein CC1_33780 [Coprococcus catus GD/7]|uniref:Uncharacterized protein n=1 Tax=Coprococcus catus GD/7 TaxID=717962 RepID=D4JC37_9FIRM|nr:hypothetical protein CC1_33780 [Coprococcus catus GD/7]
MWAGAGNCAGFFIIRRGAWQESVDEWF